MKFYRALLIEPDGDKRVKLRQVAAAAPCFDRVEPMAAFKDALLRLEQPNCDVIFIGFFPVEEATKFIEEAKKTATGRLCAYVLIQGKRQQSETDAAATILAGADGVLYEPYSVDNLVDTTKIADRIKEADAELKRQAAVSVLLTNMTSEVDNLGARLIRGEDEEIKNGLDRLKAVAAQVKVVTKGVLTEYFSLLSKAFVEAEAPPSAQSRQAYGGVSARVQRILDKKKKGG